MEHLDECNGWQTDGLPRLPIDQGVPSEGSLHGRRIELFNKGSHLSLAVMSILHAAAQVDDEIAVVKGRFLSDTDRPRGVRIEHLERHQGQFREDRTVPSTAYQHDPQPLGVTGTYCTMCSNA